MEGNAKKSTGLFLSPEWSQSKQQRHAENTDSRAPPQTY